MNCAIKLWIGRGYKNTMKLAKDCDAYTYPSWLTEKFCASHRSNLLRKNPEFYSQYEWKEPNNLPYIWPV